MFVVSYYFSLAESGQLGQPCGRPGAMCHGRAGHGSPCRSPGVGAAALTELDMRVRHWLTRCAAAGGPEYQTTVCCNYVIWCIGVPVPGAGTAGCCGLPAQCWRPV